MREGAFVEFLEIGNWRMEKREKRKRKRTKGGNWKDIEIYSVSMEIRQMISGPPAAVRTRAETSSQRWPFNRITRGKKAFMSHIPYKSRQH
jgi:hypothetical protein